MIYCSFLHVQFVPPPFPWPSTGPQSIRIAVAQKCRSACSGRGWVASSPAHVELGVRAASEGRPPLAVAGHAPAQRQACVYTPSSVASSGGAAASDQTSGHNQLRASVLPVAASMWAAAGRMSTARQPAFLQHGVSPPLRSAPPPIPHAQMSCRGSYGAQWDPAMAVIDTRRPMAAWVWRFRHDPPLPREQRLPCALDPSVSPIALAAVQRERDLSADALLAEAQRVIASLGVQPAIGPASAAGSAHGARAPGLTSPMVSQPSALLAPMAHARRFVPGMAGGRDRRPEVQLRGEPAPDALSAWDSGAVSSSSSAVTGSEQASDGSEDDEDLLERWRQRQWAQKARMLQRHTCWHCIDPARTGPVTHAPTLQLLTPLRSALCQVPVRWS